MDAPVVIAPEADTTAETLVALAAGAAAAGAEAAAEEARQADAEATAALLTVESLAAKVDLLELTLAAQAEQIADIMQFLAALADEIEADDGEEIAIDGKETAMPEPEAPAVTTIGAEVPAEAEAEAAAEEAPEEKAPDAEAEKPKRRPPTPRRYGFRK